MLVSIGKLNQAVGLYSDPSPPYLPKTDAARGILTGSFSLLCLLLLFTDVRLRQDFVFLCCFPSLCLLMIEIDFVGDSLEVFPLATLFCWPEFIDLDVVEADIEKLLDEGVAVDELKQQNIRI